ncbi:MAG: aldehyde dehydrogenase family protein [Myxococcales bacterium]|nr:MAG: aldehyde dehydrogenase family protein [Myxococcales bacterium]
MASVPSTTSDRSSPTAVRETDPRAVEEITRKAGARAEAFARTPLFKKVAALAEVRARLRARGHELASLGARAKGIAQRPGGFGEELLAGPVIIQRYVRLLGESLEQIRERGAPLIAEDRVRRLPSGEVSVQVMPHGVADRMLFMPYQVDVRLGREVDAADVRASQASFYREVAPRGAVSAVLGAGNVASIPALDVLHECFVMGRSCVLKMSPVNAYLGPAFEHIFQPISALGGLAIVYGGAEAGKALLGSPHVDHVHLTGAIETHDAIVWGPPGPERAERQRSGKPVLQKTITSELGNVSPVVVTPGHYSEQELSDVAEGIAGMLFNNASFNCNAAKLLVLPTHLAEPITSRLERLFTEQPARDAYYPGAAARFHELVAHPGDGRVWSAPAAEGQLPWTLLTGLSPDSDAESFQLEPFCPFLSVVELDEPDAPAFLDRAVRFLNEKVWGTLNAMLYFPSSAEGDPTLEAALSRAVDDLRYGTVAVNYWPAIGYGTGTPPWGGHPSATLQNAQSGIGFVHNALMLEQIRKVVLRGPLRSFPKQFYFPTHRHQEALARALFDFESTGKVLPLLRTGVHGVRG